MCHFLSPFFVLKQKPWPIIQAKELEMVHTQTPSYAGGHLVKIAAHTSEANFIQ